MAKMSKAYIEGRKLMEERLARETAKGSTASANKRAEAIGRNSLLKGGIKKGKGKNSGIFDVRARPQDKPDVVVISPEGERLHIEIKTGSGAVNYRRPGYGEPLFTKADCFNPDLIFPDKDLIAYAPCADMITDENVDEQFYIFTREEFLDCLLHMFHGRGENAGTFAAAIHVTSYGVQLNIQTVNNRPYNNLYDYIEENDIPTMGKYKEEVLGR